MDYATRTKRQKIYAMELELTYHLEANWDEMDCGQFPMDDDELKLRKQTHMQVHCGPLFHLFPRELVCIIHNYYSLI